MMLHSVAVITEGNSRYNNINYSRIKTITKGRYPVFRACLFYIEDYIIF